MHEDLLAHNPMFRFVVVSGVGNNPESVLASADKPRNPAAWPRGILIAQLLVPRPNGAVGWAATSNVDWSDSLVY
jgi:hypothetical protein